jgi:hypothetical protein
MNSYEVYVSKLLDILEPNKNGSVEKTNVIGWWYL